MFGSKDKSPTRVSDSGAARQIDTVIAEHCTLAGDLTTKNSIKLDGRIEGTLRAEGRAIIGETGSVKGDVHAADLLVLASTCERPPQAVHWAGVALSDQRLARPPIPDSLQRGQMYFMREVSRWSPPR